MIFVKNCTKIKRMSLRISFFKMFSNTETSPKTNVNLAIKNVRNLNKLRMLICYDLSLEFANKFFG